MRKSILPDLLSGGLSLKDPEGTPLAVARSRVVLGGVRSAVVSYHALYLSCTDILIETSDLPDEFGRRTVYLVDEQTGEAVSFFACLEERGGIITAS